MHSLAGCLPAGITYRLYDSRNYPQITQLVPMCALRLSSPFLFLSCPLFPSSYTYALE